MNNTGKIEINLINEGEYRSLADESYMVGIKLAKCIDNRFVDELPDALQLVRQFIDKVDGKYFELLRRPLDLLHSVLITRMFYNKKFPSPLYQYDLASMRIYAKTDVEFRNLYAIYLTALEQSLVQEA